VCILIIVMEPKPSIFNLPSELSSPGIFNLPAEISHHICSYLKLKDILTLSVINKQLHEQLNLNGFWCSLFIKEFGNSHSTIAVSSHRIKYIHAYKDFSGAPDKLKWAIKNNYPQKVKNVIYNPKNVKVCGHKWDYLLMLLEISNGVTILHILFENGWNTKNDRDYLLYGAAEKGNLELCEALLLRYKADLNYKFNNEITPLFVAASKGHINICKLFVNNNNNIAFINTQCDSGSNTLYIAAQEGNAEVVEYLISVGANIEIKFREYHTPLYIAARNNHVSTVKILIKLGAKVDVIGEDTSTPLYLACQNGHVNMVQELINSGADQNISFKESTPLYIACQKGFDQIVEILCNPSNSSKAQINKNNSNGGTDL